MGHKKLIDELIEANYRTVDDIKKKIRKLSNKELMNVKAELRAQNVHSDKWMNAFMVTIGVALSIFSLLETFSGTRPIWVYVIVIIIDIIIIAALILHCMEQCKKARRVATISIMEDMENELYGDRIADSNLTVKFEFNINLGKEMKKYSTRRRKESQ